MTTSTLANVLLPVVRKNKLSLLFVLLGLMFQLTANAQTVADIGIFKMVNKTSPSEGDTVIYTISVSNSGSTDAKDIQVKDVLPAGLTFISASATKSTYSSATNIWGADNKLDVNHGQSATLTLKAKVNTGTLGLYITNTSYITGFNGTDPDHSDDTASIVIHIIERTYSCFCNLNYPDNSNPPRSMAVFNESEVLRSFDPGSISCDTAATSIKLWYNDEHALTLGVHRVIVKTAAGTTTTDYPITPTPAGPSCVINPLVGTTIQTGDQSGNDPMDRPLWPVLYLTDLTVNGLTSRIGDWQQGGLGHDPSRVCGTWKGAVRTVDKTVTPNTVTVTPDADPPKNNWLGIPDAPPEGFAALTNQGYGAEVSWNIGDLGLIPGHIYRLQFIVHDGDQNKTGGDVGEGCTNFKLIDVCPDITAVASPPEICRGSSSTLSFINNTPNTPTVVGWYFASANGCTPIGSPLGSGTTLTVSPTVTTKYLVIVTNNDLNCNDTSCVTVTVNQKPVLTLTNGPVCDNSQSSYSITLAITGGTGPFTATATNGTAVVTGSSVTISGIPSGSGTTVQVTDAKGCISDPYDQAPHTCCPEVTAIASPPVICQGASSTLSFTGTPGVVVVGWFLSSPSGCFPTGASLGSGATLSVSPQTTTSYAVVVRNANNTCNDTSCVTVTVNSKPVLTLVSGPTCTSNQLSYSVTFAITFGTGPFTATTTAGTATVVGRTVTVTGIPSGSGTTVSVTDANGCTSDPYILEPYTCGECPVIATITSSDPDNSICQGESVQLTGHASGGVPPYTYKWTPNLGNTAGPFTVAPLVTTTYQLIVTDDSGRGCPDTTQITIIVHEKPDITATASPATICQGASSILSVGTTTPGLSIVGWFNSCPPAGANLGLFSTLLVTPGATSTYSVIATSQFGCRDTACTTVTVNPSYGNIIIDSTICEGSSVTIGGNTFTLTGNYTINLHTTLGCDSIIHLNLTVNPIKHTDVRAVICYGEQIIVGGQVFTTSVTDSIIILTSSKGCDSIIKLNLQVLNQDTITTIRVICEGEVAQIGDSTYSQAGTYYIPFINNQCRGIVKLILTVNPKTRSTINREICEGDIAVVGGQVFNATGTYTITIDNANGCDSIITLNLLVNPKKSTTIDTTLCRGETITVGTLTFSTTGAYTVPLQTSKGCDSIVHLNLIVLDNGDTTRVPLSICDGDSVVIGGQVFKQAGVYYILSPNGRCTNVIELTLTVRPNSTNVIERSICEGQVVIVGGQTFDSTGTYTIVLQNSVGCDSTITLYLSVSEGGTSSQLDTTICFGTSVTFGGQTLSTTGQYQIIFPSGDCRDTLFLNLVVNPQIVTTIDTTICEPATITMGGNAYGLTGNYTAVLTSAAGCDSTVHLNLTVNPIKHTDIDAVICQGEQITVGGQIFNTSVTDSIIILNTYLGCDSIIKINIQVLQQDTIVSDRTICEGEFVNVGGLLFGLPGTYFIPFQNNQCIGIVQLNLTVNPKTRSTVNEEICDGDILVIAGQVYATAGTYTITIQNSKGCDSIITLNLAVNPKVSTQIDSAICNGQSVTIGNSTFTATGAYTVTLQTSKGCDSAVHLNLIVLNSGDTTDVFQSICDGDSVVINGQVFKQAGTYYLNSPIGQCNNKIALHLTVKGVSKTTLVRAICQGDAIVVGGQTFTTSGIYNVVLQNSVGCDSIITLVLDVSQGGVKGQLDTTICQGNSVTFAGQIFSTTGTYQIIYPSGLCRDTLLLILTVIPIPEVTIERTICEGNSVVLGGNAYTLTGNYRAILTGSSGCDSIVNLHLIVNPKKYTNIDAVLCDGEQVTAGGQIFTTSVSNVVITLSTSQGCDSIITINLEFLKQDTIETNRTICLGDFVDIGGNIFDQTGTYYVPFQNNQCTGIVKLILVVNEPNESSISRTICEGEVVVIEGNVFSATGHYTIYTSTSLGCDSAIFLNLTVNPIKRKQIDTAVCSGQFVTIGTSSYNNTGNYQITLTSASGCDSIVTLNLAVLTNDDTSKVSQSICLGGSFTIGGQTFNLPGVYYIPTPGGPCSDLIELTLNVKQPTEFKVDRSICDGQAVVYGGQTFNTTGLYIITIQNSVGCDSTIILDLLVSQGGGHSQLDTTICEGNSVTFASQTFFQTGTYQIIYPSGLCRDTLLLNLVVIPIYEITEERPLCPNDSVLYHGTYYYQIGLYTITESGPAGCDSIFHLSVYEGTICQPILIDSIIYDTIPVFLIDTVCAALPGGTIANGTVVTCTGSNTGVGTWGTWVVDTTTACLHYTAGDTRGSNDTMCITVCDTIANTCVTTTIIITVTGLPPIAVNDTVRTAVNTPVLITELANDTTLDSDPLALTPGDEILTTPVHGTVVVNPDGTITYTPDNGYVGIDSFQYQISDPDGADTAWVFIIIENCEIPNAFSPNGDGKNETFNIPCIDINNPPFLAIYNRWGIEIYRNNAYDNTWDGTYKGTPVPDGTYYYVLKYKNTQGTEINQGAFVVVHR